MTERLNARLDAELARKVKYLRDRTKKTTTEVVKASIEAYFNQISQEPTPAELLEEFIGSSSGPANLSSDYKAALSESLERKGRA